MPSFSQSNFAIKLRMYGPVRQSPSATIPPVRVVHVVVTNDVPPKTLQFNVTPKCNVSFKKTGDSATFQQLRVIDVAGKSGLYFIPNDHDTSMITDSYYKVIPVTSDTAKLYCDAVAGSPPVADFEYRFELTADCTDNPDCWRFGGCDADFNGDGFITGEDFDAFALAFAAGAIDADFDGNGFVTGDDYDSYVSLFEIGC